MTGFELSIMCLALNVFKEARGEPVEGQHAVALVTLNRVASRGLDGDVCGTVFAKNQFSWTRTDVRKGVLLKSKRPDMKSVEWERARQSAFDAFYMKDFTCGATHYHEVKSKPYWRKKFVLVGQWGNHLFYRSKNEYQHPSEGTGRRARDPACSGAHSSSLDAERRVSATSNSSDPAQPESERSWWERLIQYVRSLY